MHHSRHECPQWLRVLDSKGIPPNGHKGAKDKALEAWKAKRNAAKAKKEHLKAFGPGPNQDTESEDDSWSESEEEEVGVGARMFTINDELNGRNWREVVSKGKTPSGRGRMLTRTMSMSEKRQDHAR